MMTASIRKTLAWLGCWLREPVRPGGIDESELAHDIRSSIQWTGWAAAVPLHIGFILIDIATHRAYLFTFLIIRATYILILVPILIVARSERVRAMEAWFVAYISLTAWSIHALLMTIGNADDPYYAGLILIVICLGGERSSGRLAYAANLSQIFIPFIVLGLANGLTIHFVENLIFLASAAGVATVGRVVVRRLQSREWAVRQRLSTEVAIANERLFATEQAAHDIRSPLSAFNVLAERAAALREDERDLARAAAARINEIANDLLARARADRDALKTRAIDSAGDLGRVLGSPALSTLNREILAEKRVQYAAYDRLTFIYTEKNCPGETPIGVGAAEYQRVLSNLIDNAVEASDRHGTIRLSVQGENGLVTVIVSDDGRGIPKEVLPHLMARGLSFGKIGGTGLGLYQARRAVAAWGGRLVITSTEGRGTEVQIELPGA